MIDVIRKNKKRYKKFIIKQEIKFEEIKNCEKANRLENEINYVKNNINMNMLKLFLRILKRQWINTKITSRD